MRLIQKWPCAVPRAPLYLILICQVAVAGCGDGKIGRSPVNGSVKVDGQPAAAMMVIFCPVGGSPEFQKVRPTGITKEDGTFSLTTLGNTDGAPVGQYKVLMSWPTQTKGPSRDGTLQMGPDRLQSRYNNLEKSPFTVEVKSGTNEIPPFELKSH